MNYKTISGEAEASFTEKKSEFIGHIAHVETNEQAVDFINRIKSENRKARHNVYAYILREQNTSRYSDDAEPQGTGGIPVLDVLKHEGLTDVCVVVTRYFGGVLLGTGGLTRAYSKGCKIAVDAAKVLNMFLAVKISVFCDYSLFGKVQAAAAAHDTADMSIDFSDDVRVEFYAKVEEADGIAAELVDITNGKASVTVGEKAYKDFSGGK